MTAQMVLLCPTNYLQGQMEKRPRLWVLPRLGVNKHDTRSICCHLNVDFDARVLPLSLLLVACIENDNVQNLNASNQVDTPKKNIQPKTISGSVTKGPMHNARIRIYELDKRGIKSGIVLADTLSDESGMWRASFNSDEDYLLVESSGGSFIDESDQEVDIEKKRK